MNATVRPWRGSWGPGVLSALPMPVAARMPLVHRELARLDKIAAVSPLHWRRHADDLGAVGARLRALGLTAHAERAMALRFAALAAWRREGSPVPEGRYCAACGAVMVRSPKARGSARSDWRLCRTVTCRSRWRRGAYVSEVEAVAKRFKLSVGDFWVTPPDLIETLSAEFGPCLLDAASTQRHAKAQAFITAEMDAFKVEWADVAPAHRGGVGFWFLNPPYGRVPGLLAWMQRAHEQARRHVALVVVLAPPGIGSAYRTWAEKNALQIRNLPRRLAFIDPITGQPVRGNTLGSSLFIFSAAPVRAAGYAQQAITF